MTTEVPRVISATSLAEIWEAVLLAGSTFAACGLAS